MPLSRSLRPRPVVIGAGPAGLTAALRLSEGGMPPVVLEADPVVGGISRTVERDGWRFDIGGHRFFTKVGAVEEMWFDLLPEDMMKRPRMSRIFYDGKFFDYPLRPANAFRNLGPVESVRCVLSYLWARARRADGGDSFESWVSARFGQRLYRTFFKTYTEKVWGVPADQIAADWAAQRIKSLSLGVALRTALGRAPGGAPTTSLIEEFHYPRFGPGMMWEACAERASALGAQILLEHPVTSIGHGRGRATEVHAKTDTTIACTDVVSTMPLGELVAAMDPAPPPSILAASSNLRHRDFLTVALVVPESAGFPDNWIYIHSPEVRLGRVQNFGAWSPYMVKPGSTCLGLEYFVNEGDELWRLPDDELIAYGARELATIGLLDESVVEAGYVTRVPKAYPVYDATYQDHVATLRGWLDTHARNVHPVGRNGMHRYNNQDHSMLTAMLAVENILEGAGHDPWSVNLDDDYHEHDGTDRTTWGGRAAPLTA